MILIFQINVYPQTQQVPILEGEESDGDVPRLGKSSTLIISLASFSLCKKVLSQLTSILLLLYFTRSPLNTPFTPSSSNMVAENLSEELRWRTFHRQQGKCCSKTQEDQNQFSQVDKIPPKSKRDTCKRSSGQVFHTRVRTRARTPWSRRWVGLAGLPCSILLCLYP